MRVTKWGEYGILCSLYLVEKGAYPHSNPENSRRCKTDAPTPIGAAEISDDLAIPVQYTQQILQRLRKGDIIKSIRGPKGGYQLLYPPTQLTLRDVLCAAEGRTFDIICESQPISAELCSVNNFCGLKDVWFELKETVDSFLHSKTLSDIAKNHSVRFHKKGEDILVPLPVSR